MAEPTAPPVAPPAPPPKSYLDSIEDQYRQALDAEEKAKNPPAAIAPVVEPPKPPEPPRAGTEPVADPGDEPEPKGMSANAASNWKKLKQERNDYSSKLKAAQAELEAERAKPRPDPKELDVLKKERDAYSERLQQLDIERHPKFQAYFEQKTTSTLALAKSIVGESNAKRLQDALEMPDGAYRDAALEELTSDLKPIQQSRLGAVVTQYDAIRQERTQHVADSRANYQKLQEDGQRQQQATQAQYQKAFEDQVARAIDPKDGLPVFQKRQGTTEADKHWNDQVDASLATARNIYQGKLDAPEIAKAALWSASAPLFLAQMRELSKTIAERDKRISELSAAQPGLDGGGNPATTADADRFKGMSYVDRMVAEANAVGAFK